MNVVAKTLTAIALTAFGLGGVMTLAEAQTSKSDQAGKRKSDQAGQPPRGGRSWDRFAPAGPQGQPPSGTPQRNPATGLPSGVPLPQTGRSYTGPSNGFGVVPGAPLPATGSPVTPRDRRDWRGQRGSGGGVQRGFDPLSSSSNDAPPVAEEQVGRPDRQRRPVAPRPPRERRKPVDRAEEEAAAGPPPERFSAEWSAQHPNAWGKTAGARRTAEQVRTWLAANPPAGGPLGDEDQVAAAPLDQQWLLLGVFRVGSVQGSPRQLVELNLSRAGEVRGRQFAMTTGETSEVTGSYAAEGLDWQADDGWQYAASLDDLTTPRGVVRITGTAGQGEATLQRK
ncbi:hypothetical protein [Botrimarina hoheduenensis]|uniref:Uncharacterized protein n=1 Tax=Botrimarina hoheduenensis TaxID=2528000 RepID=A0A5C5VZ31_9BACT|nr:hypothetical protein [Botrimarina hoheduenensis]TWT43223.1 hypothetical protein Pla111_21730 [Botrimarina hoheduenensis]